MRYRLTKSPASVGLIDGFCEKAYVNPTLEPSCEAR